MRAPDLPVDEVERVGTLNSLDIVYTPAEERFDRITRVATRLFDVPTALVSLITGDKQWFKSRQGLDAAETPRSISFCGHAILSDDIFVVSNALKDPDFRDNPLVTGPPNIRFYAGQPLKVDGHRIGTLCLLDSSPRHLKPGDYDSLRSLAKWVELEMTEWRAAKEQFIHEVLRLEQREKLLDPVTGNLNSEGIERIHSHLAARNLPVLPLRVEIEDTAQDFASDVFKKDLGRIAASLRTAVADAGIIGMAAPDRFLVYLSAADRANLELVADRIRENLFELQQAYTSIRALQFRVLTD